MSIIRLTLITIQATYKFSYFYNFTRSFGFYTLFFALNFARSLYYILFSHYSYKSYRQETSHHIENTNSIVNRAFVSGTLSLVQ